MKTGRIEFLNTYLDNLTAGEAAQAVDEMVRDGGIHYVVTPNSDIVVKMQKDTRLKSICEGADLILTDGQILVKLSRFLGTPIKERVCMTDFVWDICGLASDRGYSVYLFGGKEEALEKAEKNIRTRYPSLKIAGAYSPPYGFENDREECAKAVERIKVSGAHILLVFLGCPKQERFIAEHKEEYRVPVSFTMGGCIDFCAGSVKRAPVWMQRAGLEWFFRFQQEPCRLFRRYFIEDVEIFRLALKAKRRTRNDKKCKGEENAGTYPVSGVQRPQPADSEER